MRYHEIIQHRRPPSFRPIDVVTFEMLSPEGPERASFEFGLVAGEVKLGRFYVEIRRGAEGYIAISRDGVLEALGEVAETLRCAGCTVPLAPLTRVIEDRCGPFDAARGADPVSGG